MVRIADIKESNTSLKHGGSGLVAVVAGATNGIGASFLRQLAINTESPKIYFVGRNEAALNRIKDELSTLNATGTYIPIHAGDLTLLKNVEEATIQIKKQERKVDLLFLSQGFLTAGARDPTIEDLDRVTSIRYYSRMRFVYSLLPLLEAAPSPRVVSVLAGGQEGQIFPDDLSLKDPKNYSFLNAANGAATYNTLFMEHLHEKHPKISFVHEFPGLVNSNLFNQDTIHWGLKFFVNWIILPTIGRFVFTSLEEGGQRALYAATNGRYRAVQGTQAAEGTGLATGSNGQKGSGVYTIDGKTEPVQNEKVLQPLREQGMPEKIYEHTMQEFERILGPSAVRIQ